MLARLLNALARHSERIAPCKNTSQPDLAWQDLLGSTSFCDIRAGCLAARHNSAWVRAGRGLRCRNIAVCSAHWQARVMPRAAGAGLRQKQRQLLLAAKCMGQTCMSLTALAKCNRSGLANGGRSKIYRIDHRFLPVHKSAGSVLQNFRRHPAHLLR